MEEAEDGCIFDREEILACGRMAKYKTTLNCASKSDWYVGAMVSLLVLMRSGSRIKVLVPVLLAENRTGLTNATCRCRVQGRRMTCIF